MTGGFDQRPDRLVRAFLFLAGLSSVLITLAVIFVLADETMDFFKLVSLKDFLFGTRWEPLLEPKSFGVLPLVCGTFLVVLGSILMAVPMGIVTATYLNEMASERMRSLIKPVLEVLAGIPTVVYGFFGFTFITPYILKPFFPDILPFNALSASIVVAIMILPMMASLCDDAFRAVPMSMREGAYALGATSFEVITQVIMPAAASRIGAAVILSVSRAVGETMAVTLAAGATPKLTANPLESVQTMTAYIVQVSLGDTPHGGVEYLTCFAVASLLFVMTLLMNIVGHKFVRRVSWERS